MIIIILLAVLFGMAFGLLLTGQSYGAIFGALFGYLLTEVIHLRYLMKQLRQQLAARLTQQPPSRRPDVAAEPQADDSPLQPEPIASEPETSVVEPAAAMPQTEPVSSPAWTPTPQTAFEPSPSMALINNVTAKAWGHVKRFFSTGNVVAKLGIITLFFGLAFLIKYAAEHDYFPIELRLIVTALIAITLIFLGWKMRHKRLSYALVLQGGGLGVFYLVVFMAYRLYALIPSPLTFLLLCLLTLFGGLLAILQDARSLAVMAILGGFLAPILASSGSGQYIVLFSYYAILNAGILFIARYKSWRELNLLGFIFTFVIGTLWGLYSYRVEEYGWSQFFLIVYFLFYVLIPIFNVPLKSTKTTRWVDGSLVFGVPLISYVLQIGLVSHFQYGIAISSLILGLFYSSLATWLWDKEAKGYKILGETYLGLAVLFTTVAVPLAFDGLWSGTVWALEGACIVWLSLRQDHLLGRAFGVLLQLGAGVLFLTDFADLPASVLPLLNAAFLGSLTLAVAGLLSAYLLRTRATQQSVLDHALGILVFVWGVIWWVAAFYHQLVHFLFPSVELPTLLQYFLGNGHLPFYNVLLLVIAASGGLAWWLRQRCQWSDMRYLVVAMLAGLVMTAFTMSVDVPNDLTLFPWLLVFLVWYWILYRHETDPQEYLAVLHGVSALLVLWVVTRYGYSQVAAWPVLAETWRYAIIAVIPAVYLIALHASRLASRWPLSVYSQVYYAMVGAIVGSILLLWSLAVNYALSGDVYPLVYLPLLNPLDVAQALVLVALLAWIRMPQVSAFWQWTPQMSQWMMAGLALLTFIWLNGVLLRTLHHWAHIPYYWRFMWDSQLVQTALSIFWTVLALGCTVLASNRHWRSLWFIGASLIAIVVVKLFAIDLVNQGTIERIISFVGVGLLLLLIGYFSPLPPRKQTEQAEKSQENGT